jgi:hypothetical protein
MKLLNTIIIILLMYIINASLAFSELPKKSIHNIAVAVRILFETNQVPKQLLKNLYNDYNSDIEDLDLFLERAKELFPSLNCGLTSVYLKDVLKEGKIVNGKYNENNHTFLLIENTSNNTIIVDITADQYGGPKVYVGPLQSPWTVEN